MHKVRAQQLLRGNGTGFPDAEWRILKPLLRSESCPHGDASVLALLTRLGLCNWALDADPFLRDAPEQLRAAIAKAAQREFAACAQRKLALLQFDALAEKRGCTPVLFKGAANATAFYGKESLRTSGDIDVMMSFEEAVRCFPKSAGTVQDPRRPEARARHLPRDMSFGYPIEPHLCLLAPETWGGFGDLAENSLPMDGYTKLRRPNPATAFTIALLHFALHAGGAIFDILDAIRISHSDDFSFDEAVALWHEMGLTHQVLPALTVFDTVSPMVPAETWNALFNGLARSDRHGVLAGLRLLAARRFAKLRLDWFRSRLMGPSLTKHLIRRLAGTKETTQDLTKLQPKNPLFWFYHLLVLPTKRLVLFWK